MTTIAIPIAFEPKGQLPLHPNCRANRRVPAAHTRVSADHMTLTWQPSLAVMLDLPMGDEVDLVATATAADTHVQVRVRPQDIQI